MGAAPGEFSGPRTLLTADRVNAAEASPAINIDDLAHAACFVSATVDGTATLQVDVSPDGTSWAPLGATIASSGLVTATGVSVLRAVEGAAGQPLRVKAVRLRATAYTDGTYTLTVCGEVSR